MAQQQETSPAIPVSLQAPRHDQIVGALSKHSCIQNASLLDHRWIICLDNPVKKRNAYHALNFDVIIAPGKRLTDPNSSLILSRSNCVLTGACRRARANS